MYRFERFYSEDMEDVEWCALALTRKKWGNRGIQRIYANNYEAVKQRERGSEDQATQTRCEYG